MSNFDPHHDYHTHDQANNCLDEDGEIVVGATQDQEARPYSLQTYDIIGSVVMASGALALGVTNSLVNVGMAIGSGIQQATHIIAREWISAAAFERNRQVEAQKRRLIVEDLAAFERGEMP